MDPKRLLNILSLDPFSLFDLPREYSVDQASINKKYYELQKIFHPDKSNLNELQELTCNVSAHINQSFKILKSPVERAITLLNLNGDLFVLQSSDQLPPELLMAQLEIYEQIEENKNNLLPLQQLEDKITLIENKLSQEINENFCNDKITLIKQNIIELAFYNRIKLQISAHLDNFYIV